MGVLLHVEVSSIICLRREVGERLGDVVSVESMGGGGLTPGKRRENPSRDIAIGWLAYYYSFLILGHLMSTTMLMSCGAFICLLAGHPTS